MLFYRHRLTGKCRFPQFEIGRFEDTQVRRQRVPRLQKYDVPGYKRFRRHDLLAAVTNHHGVECGHTLQRRHGTIGPVLLYESHRRVEHDYAEDHDGILDVADDARNDRGSDQQQDQKVGKLSKQHTELAPPRALADGIWPVMCLPLCHFGFGKTVCPVGPKLGDSRGGIQNVPDL